VDMTAFDAIDLIRTHSANWMRMEKEASAKGDYHSAQSCLDMAFAAEALIAEIERVMYNMD